MSSDFIQNPITKRFIKIFNQLKSEGKFRSNAAFAKSIEYTPQAFNEVIQERRDIPLQNLYVFFNTYNIDPAIVFLDKVSENTVKKEFNPYTYERSDVKIHPVLVNSDNEERIPLVSKKASAGYLAEFQNDEFIANLPSISLLPGLEHKSLYGFEVEGDSMEPNLYEGDWLYCSLVEKLEYIKPKHIHVLVCKSGIVVKRITKIDHHRQKVYLSSDNPQYPNYGVAFNEILQIWYLEKALTCHFPDVSSMSALSDRVIKLEEMIAKKFKNPN
jgi:SOS-response transcriptional repressor LexA